MSPNPLPTRSTYVGLFFVALATLMYEILLTRIFSVTMLYHFAFVALSVAMFGMTVGALVVYLLPQVFTPERLPRAIAWAALAFPVAMLFSFLTELCVPFRVHPSIVAIYAIVFTYAVIAVPFIVSGIVVCLTLTGYPARVSGLYAADLSGAALGCVALIPVLDYSDGPTAVLWVCWLASLGAVAFYRGVERWYPSEGSAPSYARRQSVWGWAAFAKATASCAEAQRRRGPTRSEKSRQYFAPLLCFAFFAAAAGHTALVWKGFPIFRILYVKGSFEARPFYEKWNSYSRVRVNGNPSAEIEPQGWGLSSAMPSDLRVRQLQMDIDVVAGTVMTAYDGNPASVRHLGYDLTNLAYRLRPHPRALVIGAGGGRDVLSGLTLGATSIVAVEINKDILRTVNARFGDFTGHIDRDPRVRFVNDEARSYVARAGESYDLVQISLIDTWAATAAGAFVLSENAVYTAEAWTIFLRHLTPDGLLSVSRWYFRDSPAEMYRSVTLAVEALRRAGISDPRAHIAIVRNMNLANRPETPDGVGTLLVSVRPFSAEELSALDAVASDLRFEVMFSPRASRDPMFGELTGPDREAVVDRYPLRIAAPTDDSPFFFNMLRLRDILRFDLLSSGKQSNNLKAVATLGVLLGTVTLLTGLCIVLPLWLTPRTIGGRPTASGQRPAANDDRRAASGDRRAAGGDRSAASGQRRAESDRSAANGQRPAASDGRPAASGERPAASDRPAASGERPAALFIYFIAIGLGFMLIETSQMQRLIIALGHPTYGLSVVLFALLLSSGIGSFLTSSVTPASAPAAGRVRLLALLGVLAAFGFLTPAVVRAIEPASTFVRILVSVLVLTPAGLLMGMAFPLGMKLAAERASELLPWLWGLNGAASVLASVLGVCIALAWSISAAFWAGFLCYVVALIAFVVVRSEQPATIGEVARGRS